MVSLSRVNLVLLAVCLQVALSFQVKAETLKQRIVLLGDAGYSVLSPLEPSLKLAANISKEKPAQTKVLFLGDNIYTRGFPVLKKAQESYSEKQLRQISYLKAQLQVAKISGSQSYLLPGNHDWQAKQLDEQAAFIHGYASQHKLKAALVPYKRGKSPLPEIVHLDGISLLFIDSTWWLRKSGKNINKVNEKLDELLGGVNTKYPAHTLLVASHHPIKSIGPHGNLGKLDECIQAITCKHRKVGDIAHPVSQKAFKALKQRLANLDNVIYAAGHDHSLQVFEFDNEGKQQVALVSGAANQKKLSAVGQSSDNVFALSKVGFMVLDVFQNDVQLKVYTADKSQVVFTKTLLVTP